MLKALTNIRTRHWLMMCNRSRFREARHNTVASPSHNPSGAHDQQRWGTTVCTHWHFNSRTTNACTTFTILQQN